MLSLLLLMATTAQRFTTQGDFSGKPFKRKERRECVNFH